MRRLRWLLAIPFTFMLGHLGAVAAAAHPLGNFTVSRYNELAFAPGVVAIEAIVDMAEIPTLQTIGAIDQNSSGQVDPAEADAFRLASCAELVGQLDLAVAGQPVALALASSELSFPPGAGGLLTLRLRCALRGDLGPVDDSAAVAFADRSYPDRLGWRELVVTAAGLGLSGEVAGASQSDKLRAYPNDMLSSPLDQRTATR